jgi:CheY-like chemotaxis protein
MSHELRTPLNSLLILSQVLAENRHQNLTPEQVKFAQTVYTSGHELLSLINEILDLSKVEAGKMPIVPKKFSLAEVKDYLEQTFRHVADQKNLSFEIQMGPDLPSMMFSDVNRLQQILKNLLSNAFKFTSKGGVIMRLVPERSERGTMVAFAVVDSGIGIPPEKQKMIFEAFQQADGTTSRKYGGTGLGLTISREIARLLGGSIDVRSVPGEGSTFTLRVPEAYAGADLAWRDEQALAKSATDDEEIPDLPEDVSFVGTRVLLVDDDLRNIFALRTVLEARGIEVLHAANGRVALEMLENEAPVDLVLMDTMMPELDGLSATRKIRESAELAALPIISLTAKAMQGDREKALEAGASGYVTKPVDPGKLLSVIHLWRQKSSAQGAAGSS